MCQFAAIVDFGNDLTVPCEVVCVFSANRLHKIYFFALGPMGLEKKNAEAHGPWATAGIEDIYKKHVLLQRRERVYTQKQQP